MVVLKFGGSSLADSESIHKVAQIIATHPRQGEGLAVVFSASGDTTDRLLEAAGQSESNNSRWREIVHQILAHHQALASQLLKTNQQRKDYLAHLDTTITELNSILHGVSLLGECSTRAKDLIAGIGERLSTPLMTTVLRDRNINASYIDARNLIKTDSTFGQAKVLIDVTNNNIRERLQAPSVYCITGFISSDSSNVSTTLGRGGSDYSAAILGAALDVDQIEIWTDVDGVLTTDPRIVKAAFTINHLSYEEAQELSHFGAKVLYAPTIIPAINKGIPIVIKNTFNPNHNGTYISNNKPETTAQRPIKGITAIPDISLITVSGSGMVGIPGISSRLFSALAQKNINIILITQGSSEHAITIGISPNDADAAASVIDNTFDVDIQRKEINPSHIESNLSVLALVGSRMKELHGIAGKIFSTLGDARTNVRAISQGSSELNVSIVVEKKDLKSAIKALHRRFFQQSVVPIHLFIVGAGLVGKTFLDQLVRQVKSLLEDHGLDIKIAGIANSRNMLIDASGVSIPDAYSLLSNSDQVSDISQFIQEAGTLDLANPVFVDITASGQITNHYKEAIDAGLNIATPNKIALASGAEEYDNLIQHAKNNNRFIVYETTVGAGLPIINTIEGLIKSGDAIIKIEGILSGSLSYIFNQLALGTSYSEAIKKARDLGFTEPDPRDDLSGLDFKRKLTILAHLSGFKPNLEQMQLPQLLPASLLSLDSVNELMDRLDEADEHLAAPIAEAKEQNRKLKLIGAVSHDQATLSVAHVAESSPFYNLSGSDNVVAIYTQRYYEQPLIIRGPGAGADVTAGGLMADIIASFKGNK